MPFTFVGWPFVQGQVYSINLNIGDRMRLLLHNNWNCANQMYKWWIMCFAAEPLPSSEAGQLCQNDTCNFTILLWMTKVYENCRIFKNQASSFLGTFYYFHEWRKSSDCSVISQGQRRARKADKERCCMIHRHYMNGFYSHAAQSRSLSGTAHLSPKPWLNNDPWWRPFATTKCTAIFTA